MKTKEELNALKEEIATLNNKLKEFTTEELKQASGGDICSDDCNVCPYIDCPYHPKANDID